MLLSKFSIRKRIIIGAIILALLSVGIVLFSILNNEKIIRITRNSSDKAIGFSDKMSTIALEVGVMERLTNKISQTTNVVELEELVNTLGIQKARVDSSFESAIQSYPEFRTPLTQARAVFNKWKPIRDSILNYQLLGAYDKAGEFTRISATQWSDSLRVEMNRLRDLANQSLVRENSTAETLRKRMVRVSLLVIIIGLLLAAATVILVGNSIAIPLRHIVRVSRRHQQGDLASRCNLDDKSELGALASAIDEMTESISSRITEKDSALRITSELVASGSLDDFISRVLKILSKESGAVAAVFYQHRENSEIFTAVSSIGVDIEKLNPLSGKYFEGEIGKALSERNITMLNIDNGTAKFRFHTLAGDLEPNEIMALPVSLNGSVTAAITLAHLKGFSGTFHNVAQQILPLINETYKAFHYNHQVTLKSQQLIDANRQLEQQAEELSHQAEEIQQQAEELSEQNMELEEQKSELEAADKLKSEFLSNVSHELRTPLNSIIALSRVLISQADNKMPVKTDYLTTIERNGSKLLEMINDLLDLSSIEAGHFDISLSAVAPEKVVNSVVQTLEPVASQKKIALVFHNGNNYKPVLADEKRLSQVLLNIAGNAVKFTEEGSVTISIEQDSAITKFVVEDTGVGIDRDFLPHLFDRFTQFDGTMTRKHQGSGLGLHIAKNLVTLMNGKIEVNSTPGAGSRFEIYIPNFDSDSEIPAVPAPVKEISHTDLAPVLKNKTILAVEDNPVTLEELKMFFGNYGARLETVTSGDEAFEWLKKEKADLILLDLMLPGKDGKEVLAELKNEDKLKDIPVVVLTATHLTNKNIEKIKNLGAADVLAKGAVSRNNLIELISSVLI
ncbi:MAG: ATP-binding protein [Bacteroidales bacterium]